MTEEVQDRIISSSVTRRENAIDDATLTGDNEKSKTYLESLKIGSIVCIKYYYTDKPGDGPTEVFRGVVDEVNPGLSSQDIITVHATSKAIALKDMRVLYEYGTQCGHGLTDFIEYNDTYHVNAYDGTFDEWIKHGVSPWLADFPDPEDDNIEIVLDPDNVGRSCGWFECREFEQRSNVNFDTLWLEVHAACIGSGNARAYINVTLYDGSHYIYLPPKTISTDDWYIWDLKDAVDVNNINLYKIKIILTGYPEVYVGCHLFVYGMCIYALGSGYSIDETVSSLRDILCDSDFSIIPNYVEHIMGGTIESGHSLGTDYIYDYPGVFTYLRFPMESAFDSIRDLIVLSTAMSYEINPSDWRGLHWIVLPDGNLCIAPVGDHDVVGASTFNVESVWPTYARSNPLEVTQHMIIEDFVQEEPEANCIIVNGLFQYPAFEFWTEGHSDYWYTPDGLLFDSNGYNDSDIFPMVGDQSIRLRTLPVNAPTDATFVIFSRGVEYPSFNLGIDVTKLGSRTNCPTIKFWCRKGGDETDKVELLMGTGYFTDNDYYVIDITDQLTGEEWVKCEVEIGPYTNPNNPWLNFSDADWSKIDWIGFRVHKSETLLQASGTVWVDGLMIEGNIIRGAMNSTSIGVHKCKTKFYKDTVSHTDSLGADTHSPLAKALIAELLRSQHPLLHGRIVIELDPHIMAGQIIHIHSGRTDNLVSYPTGFKIDRDFRIAEVFHSYSTGGATSTLTLVDDLKNSIVIGPLDAYSAVIRATSPDFQNKSIGSLTSKDVDIGQEVLFQDYPS